VSINSYDKQLKVSNLGVVHIQYESLSKSIFFFLNNFIAVLMYTCFTFSMRNYGVTLKAQRIFVT